jgi:hypothetical protein
MNAFFPAENLADVQKKSMQPSHPARLGGQILQKAQ